MASAGRASGCWSAALSKERLLTLALAAAVAVAFADSSIVVLALPDLYGEFDTSIVGISWVITSYNLVVAAAAFALVPVASRLSPSSAGIGGVVLFAAASAGCAASWRLEALIAFRCVQGLGAAFMLMGALRGLAALSRSERVGAAAWTAAGTIGAAAGPALGGVLTQLADWRAIFGVQVPLSLVALAALRDGRLRTLGPERRRAAQEGAWRANVALGLVFGALVGALFLSVILIVTVWSVEPLVGSLVVSSLPAATLAARPLASRLPGRTSAAGGALLLAAGLVALALLPRVSEALVAVALAFCGLGLGLTVPVLTAAALDPEGRSARSGLVTVGARHAGLVLALVLVAPLLSHALDRSGRRALLASTKVVLDGNVPLRQKVPIALDLRDALEEAKKGEVPDLRKPFDKRGARSDERLRRLRDDLTTALESVVTRGFRSSFALAALLAALAAATAALLGRRTT